MRATGFNEEREPFSVQFNESVPMKVGGKLAGTQAVFSVVAIVMTAGIMQQGKEHDDIAPQTGRSVTEV